MPSPGTISVTSKEMQNAASGPGISVVCGREHYLLSSLAGGLLRSKIQLKEEG